MIFWFFPSPSITKIHRYTMALISIVHFIIFHFKRDLRNKYSFLFILCFYETRAEEMRTLNLHTWHCRYCVCIWHQGSGKNKWKTIKTFAISKLPNLSHLSLTSNISAKTWSNYTSRGCFENVRTRRFQICPWFWKLTKICGSNKYRLLWHLKKILIFNMAMNL